MADATKHHATINGGSLLSELKSLFSILRTKRVITFAYGFMFAFLAFTIFLAFNPSSNSSSPQFNNLFTTSLNSTSSSRTTSIFSGDSYRSHFSSIFSHFFPNSSQQAHKNSPLQSPISTTRSKNATNQQPILNKESPNSQNHTRTVQALKPNQSPKSPVSANQSGNSVPKVQPQSQNKGLNDKVKKNFTEVPKVQPQSQNKGLNDKVKKNFTEVPKVQSQSQNKGLNDKVKKNAAGKEEKRVIEKGVVANLSSSLLKKQSNKTIAAVVSAKQRTENFVESLMNCNLFDGEWVRDVSYPLYKRGSCSLIDEQFNCFLNGRPDNGYHQLKWKPKGCNLPRLNGSHMLELLRGKRLVFVGDSLNRNMWESLICILRNSVKDKSKVYEASGRHHFRTEASYSFVFKDYDCTVEFFVSPFIVQEWEMVGKNGLKKETLRLDIIGRSADQYKSADILIFNTGHWWTHEKTSKGKDYYQEGSHVYSELNVDEAFRRAVTTWGRWVDAHINPKKTLVFFRGYSASHFSGGQWNSGGQCDHETEPIKNKTYLSQYPPKMKALESVLKGMKTKVSYLNITRMTDYRKDGHPSIYRKQHLTEEERRSPLRFQDCSHWCLPGVPDSWNELLYAELLRRKHNQKQ